MFTVLNSTDTVQILHYWSDLVARALLLFTLYESWRTISGEYLCMNRPFMQKEQHKSGVDWFWAKCMTFFINSNHSKRNTTTNWMTTSYCA